MDMPRVRPVPPSLRTRTSKRAAAAATAAAVAAAALAAVAILTAAVVVVALTAAATTFHLAAPAPSSWASGQRFLLRNRQRRSPRRRKYVYIAISLIKLIKLIRTRSRGIALYRGVSRCIAHTIRRKLLVRVGVEEKNEAQGRYTGAQRHNDAPHTSQSALSAYDSLSLRLQ